MKNLYRLQSLVLLGGTVFAWYTVVQDFRRFFDYEGTLLKFSDCFVPNPLMTPCFYGAFAFLIAFIWSLSILFRPENQAVRHGHLRWLLVAGVIFAWSVNIYELIKWYSRASGEPAIGCSGTIVSNPYSTPCFVGASIFLLALIVSLVIIKKNKTSQSSV
ncbi:MAG: hypothetical protein V1838_04875 [Patescibacteria group bacterium]